MSQAAVGLVRNRSIVSKRAISWIRRYGLVIAVYIVAMGFTVPYYMGDTSDYVDCVLAYDGSPEHISKYPLVEDFRSVNRFWDFGHLLWPPLGWLCYNVFNPLTSKLVGPDPFANAVFIMIGINWVAGLMSVVLLFSLISHIYNRAWVSNFVTCGFIFTNSILNMGQTGSSYYPGIAFILLGTYLLVSKRQEPGRTLGRAIPAGLALAIAVCFWFPYVLVIPAALALPLFLLGAESWRRRLVIEALGAFCLFTALIYAAVCVQAGIRTVDDFKVWAMANSYGIDQILGFQRMVFGFARCFINMANDGVLFKRFMVDDPFNPVSAVDLLRLSLWKVAFFYIFSLSVLLNLLRSQSGRRALGMFAVAATPLALFALFVFEAGDVTRYLPLVPFFYIAVAHSLASDRSLPSLKYVSVAFIAVAILVNAWAMAGPISKRREEALAAKIMQLQPLLRPGSIVVAPYHQDELVDFYKTYPLNPVNRNFPIYSLVTPNTSEVLNWQQVFASRVLLAWSGGGDVWISKSAFTARPEAAWNWVEGTDERLSWNDIYTFFSKFDLGRSVGDDGGFVLLSHSAKNENLLSTFAGDTWQIPPEVKLSK